MNDHTAGRVNASARLDRVDSGRATRAQSPMSASAHAICSKVPTNGSAANSLRALTLVIALSQTSRVLVIARAYAA